MLDAKEVEEFTYLGNSIIKTNNIINSVQQMINKTKSIFNRLTKI